MVWSARSGSDEWAGAAAGAPSGQGAARPDDVTLHDIALHDIAPGERAAALNSVLAARPPRKNVVRFLGHLLVKDPIVGGTLFEAHRWSIYLEALHAAAAEGRIAGMGADVAIQMAHHLPDMGRPAAIWILLKGLPADCLAMPQFRIAAARALLAAGDRTAARSQLGTLDAEAPLDVRLLAAWIDRHDPALPPGPAPAGLLEELASVVFGDPAASAPWPAIRNVPGDPAAAQVTVNSFARSRVQALEIVSLAAPEEFEKAANSRGLDRLGAALKRLPGLDLGAWRAARPDVDMPAHFAEELFSTHLGAWDADWLRQVVDDAARADLEVLGLGQAFPDPFGDGLLRARKAVLFDASHVAHFFTSADPARCFAVLSLCYNRLRRDVLLLPHSGLAVQLTAHGGMDAPASGIGLFLDMVRVDHDALLRLLVSPHKPVMVTGLNPNIGHHYHNELAALDDLHRRLPAAAAMPLLMAGPDYYGANRLLRGDAAVAAPRFATPRALGSHCLKHGLSPVWSSTVRAPLGLARRVIERAGLEAAGLVKQLVGELGVKGPRDGVVLIMLRSNRRVWQSQHAGVLAIIARLVERQDITRFILDGVTLTDRDDAHQQTWIAREAGLADALIAEAKSRTPKARIASIVGLSMYEKVAAHGLVHFGITPKGNGAFPNLSWVRNVPLVEHGNAHDLATAMVETRYREDAVLPLLVDRDAVIDSLGPAMDAGNAEISPEMQLSGGYDLDEGALLELVEECARGLQAYKKLAVRKGGRLNFSISS